MALVGLAEYRGWTVGEATANWPILRADAQYAWLKIARRLLEIAQESKKKKNA